MNKIQKKRFHLRANKAMKRLVKTMLYAEDRLELKLKKFRGKNKKHHWSIWMVGKQVQLELVKK